MPFNSNAKTKILDAKTLLKEVGTLVGDPVNVRYKQSKFLGFTLNSKHLFDLPGLQPSLGIKLRRIQKKPNLASRNDAVPVSLIPPVVEAVLTSTTEDLGTYFNDEGQRRSHRLKK